MNKSANESMRTNIHRKHEDEIQSYPQHVSKSKKENENNSEKNLQVNLISANFLCVTLKHVFFISECRQK